MAVEQVTSCESQVFILLRSGSKSLLYHAKRESRATGRSQVATKLCTDSMNFKGEKDRDLEYIVKMFIFERFGVLNSVQKYHRLVQHKILNEIELFQILPGGSWWALGVMKSDQNVNLLFFIIHHLLSTNYLPKPMHIRYQNSHNVKENPMTQSSFESKVPE